uniref:NADH dehydrogenase subunit 4L n=1 Tax=Pseudocrangonyx daejeonensis TaxID=2038767 RepID=A0A346SAG3_9CRUS|nr:NADH dehydrogenase subunit 4L [Pseudocrangonyx daejeonensis]AXT17551.1 NADH dehydrogenase subunit 4L [Pseudocrangonyx daejeonensis]
MSSLSMGLVIMLMGGLFKVAVNYNRLLNSLLSLELASLSLYGLGMLFFWCSLEEVFVLLYFLVMMVCEGVLGLTLLVLVMRSHSSDMMMMANCSVC